MLREQLVLQQCWRFQVDPENAGESLGYWRSDYDVSRWREISVPCGLERGHPDLEWYMGAGWYQRTFHVPASWRGKRVTLRFEGVNYHAQVWVNGELVGKNEDGFLPFEIPIQGQVRFGEENTLIVRADNEPRMTEVPGTNVGWRPYGGILREVYLRACGNCFIETVRIVADPGPAATGSLYLQAWVTNETSKSTTLALQVTVTDGDGKGIGTFTSTQVVLKAGEKATLEVRGALPNVTPWSPEHPVLYSAQTFLLCGAEALDQVDTRFGFRHIATEGQKVLLNGEPLYLMGFNRHEDSPETGGCSDLVTVRRDLEDMKAMGCNFIRLCHYPHHPGELDLCDEIGLLAMDEIPVWGSAGMAETPEQWPAKMVNARRQLDTMIRRDWNHPSVIFWSVSNETHEDQPVVVEGNTEMIRYAKGLDPSRLVVHVSDHFSPRHGDYYYFDTDDVICLNDYPWEFDGGTVAPERIHEMGEYWVTYAGKVRAKYPDKPILISEFGYRSFEGMFDNVLGEDRHALVLEAQLAVMNPPNICGAVIWCYADHAGALVSRPGPARRTSTSTFGVVTRRRKPKTTVYQAVKRIFAARKQQMDT